MERRSLDLIAAARANALLEAGAEWASGSTLSINAAGGCMRPATITIAHSNVAGRRFAARKIFDASMFWDIDTPCRRCEACLRSRKAMWTARAIRETKAAQRSWFVTLTANPEHRMRLLGQARIRYARSGDLETLSEAEQFRRLCAEWNVEITLWLKRVREESRAQFRYLAVFEKHASGDPHVHLLVHERLGGGAVTKRQLQGQWRFGYSHTKLVQAEDGTRAVYYVCKYIAKEALTRIRASRFYGDPPTDERNPVAPALPSDTVTRLPHRAEKPVETDPQLPTGEIVSEIRR